MTQDMIFQPDPVSCETFEEYALAIVDGEVDGAVFVALEAHRSTCDSCAALLTDLVAIKHDASMLPQLTPSHDLWSGIADRIGTPVVQLSPHRAASPVTAADGRATAWYRRPWPAAAAAAAAALLVASSALLTYNLVGPDGTPDPTAAVVVATSATPPAAGATSPTSPTSPTKPTKPTRPMAGLPAAPWPGGAGLRVAVIIGMWCG